MAAALDRCVRSTSSGLKAAQRQNGLIGNGNAGQTSKSPLPANHRKIKNADQDQSPSQSTVRGLGTGGTATEEWSSHKLRRFVLNRKKATA
jgi:hypothetical protein